MLPAKVHFGKSQSNRRSVSKKKENEKTEDEKTSGIFLSSQYVDGADRLLWLIYRLELTAGSLFFSLRICYCIFFLSRSHVVLFSVFLEF